MRKIGDLKLKVLGIVPRLEDRTGVLEPEEIVALSALLTFKGKSVTKLRKEIKSRGEDLKEKVRVILANSSLRGHASMATTPTLAIAWEGSKFLDSTLTGIVFSSSLMASGRRTSTTAWDIIVPPKISKKPKAKEIYLQESKENIHLFNKLLKLGIQKDEPSKILQYGIYGTGLMVLPVESIISVIREYENEANWMPEEVEILMEKIQKQLKKLGIFDLYHTRQVAPRNIYPYPNIFKDPKRNNLVRQIRQKHKFSELPAIVSLYIKKDNGLKKELNELWRMIKSMVKEKKIEKEWQKVLLKRREIVRDFGLCFYAQVLSSVSWRVWGEKKRHRTVPMVVESMYYMIERAIDMIKKLQTSKTPKLRKLKLIDSVFAVPPTIGAKPEYLEKWFERIASSLDCYKKLLNLGIPAREAIFIIPRGIRIDVLQDYNLYNLITGYYPLRLCITADEQLNMLTIKEAEKMKKALKNRGFDWLARHIVPKCQITGFCPERNFCRKIKSLVDYYDQGFHQRMHRGLGKLASISRRGS